MTTAYNPESMVNLKAAPETVDRTARVTYRGLCAPKGFHQAYGTHQAHA